MMNRIRPIWQILIIATQTGQETTLNCDECFALMEYLAAQALQGADPQSLLEAVKQHFDHCPDCREHHLQRLLELEEMLANR